MKNLRKQLEERIPTMEAAYKETDRPQVDFSNYPEDLRANRKSEYDAIVLVEAARKIERENNSEEIDWSNWNQYKWIPWFKMGGGSPAGFRFDGSCCDDTCASAGSGSRLRVLNKETATYLGEKFLEVWENVQLK